MRFGCRVSHQGTKLTKPKETQILPVLSRTYFRCTKLVVAAATGDWIRHGMASPPLFPNLVPWSLGVRTRRGPPLSFALMICRKGVDPRAVETEILPTEILAVPIGMPSLLAQMQVLTPRNEEGERRGISSPACRF